MDAGSDEKELLQLRKLESETRKLNLEIIEIQRWWRRPAYVQSVLSVAIAVIAATGALITAHVNGWFDAKSAALRADTANLQMQKAQVQSEIKTLNEGKTELHAEIASLKDERDQLKREVETYKRTAKEARTNASALQIKLANESTQRAAAEVRIKQLQGILGNIASNLAFRIAQAKVRGVFTGESSSENQRLKELEQILKLIDPRQVRDTPR